MEQLTRIERFFLKPSLEARQSETYCRRQIRIHIKVVTCSYSSPDISSHKDFLADMISNPFSSYLIHINFFCSALFVFDNIEMID